MVTDEEFRELLAGYIDTATPEMAGVELDFADGNPDYGAMHALGKHGVSKEEVRQVIYESPLPEEKRSRHAPRRTLLWGSTRRGRDITVVVHDENVEGLRRLTLITAFDETEVEWRKRR